MSQLFSGKDNVSLQSAMFQRIGNMPKAKVLKKSKRGILEPL